MVRYVRCEECKRIVRLLDGERKCIYCGNDSQKVDYRSTDKYLWVLMFLGACWICIAIGVIVVELWG